MADWNKRFLMLAKHIAEWSKDPSTKVGCVIVDDTSRTVLGMGYNGFPRGVEDSDERLNDRDLKYPMVQHAETNAIHNSSVNLAGATAYVTAKPCANCCGALIQVGVKRIIALPTPDGLQKRLADNYVLTDAMMDEAKIEFIEID